MRGSPPAQIATPGTIVAAGVDPDGNPVPAHVDFDVTTPAGALPGRAPYRLGVDPTGLAALGLGLDPLRAFLPVRLRPECGDAPDCVVVPTPPPPLTPPDYDTLARDYTGLRAMLMERLGALDPGADTSPADITVTLIELMAHLGDLLSYRQDRVATEAWLGTARRRANVTTARPPGRLRRAARDQRRHGRAGARWPTPAPARWTPRSPSCRATPPRTPLPSPDDAPDGAHFTVELAAPTTVRASHAEIALYDWAEADAVLPAGATSAVLVRPTAADAAALADWLPVGSLLGFEVVDPGPAGPQAQWARRLLDWPPALAPDQTRVPLASHPAQVVRVTHAVAITDPLAPALPLVRVFWEQTDALTAPCR